MLAVHQSGNNLICQQDSNIVFPKMTNYSFLYHHSTSSETLDLHVTFMVLVAETNSPDIVLVALQLRVERLCIS